MVTYYFAYDTNLNKKQMLERCPDSKLRFTVTLPNYKLVFVGWSRQWRGGTATIRPLRGEKVFGALYEVSERDLRRLDNDAGLPGRASRLNITVFNEDGEAIPAVTYIQTGKLEETKPSPEYLSIIQQGYRDFGLV